MDTRTATLVLDESDVADSGATIADLPGRLCMHFQPDVDLRTNIVGSCEALLRWDHPDYGPLRPGISLAGSRWTDQIRSIEEWALVAACRQAAAWRQRGLAVQVAMNVSTAQLLGPRFLPSLDRAIIATGVSPQDLAIDVPFGALAADVTSTRWITTEIAERGFDVVIDGVGGGASLGLLDNVTAATWKIDLHVGGLRHPGLHPAVAVAFARAQDAGAVTVAKAVEDLHTLDEVRSMGFDRAFGHAVGHPLTATRMEEVLGRGTVAPRRLFGVQP